MALRIAIVHHDPSARTTLWRLIQTGPDYTVAWMTGDATEALERCRRERPEILLIDLALTGLGGAQLVCDIMKKCPCAVLVLADVPNKQTGKVFEAMGCGALDAVTTPCRQADGTLEGESAFLKKLGIMAKLLGKSAPPQRPSAGEPQSVLDRLPILVAIGSSTGGPKALAAILAGLPSGLAAAVVIAQHVDLQFAGGLAEWLNSQTALTVMLAREGMRPAAGVVLVAGTNDHLVVGADLAFHYTMDPVDYPYRPSVNALFESLHRFWPRQGVATLLTGMGRDGGTGMALLRKAGWHTIAQDEKTSVVYGMPAAAVELGGATEILPLDGIAGAILKRLPRGASGKKI